MSVFFARTRRMGAVFGRSVRMSRLFAHGGSYKHVFLPQEVRASTLFAHGGVRASRSFAHAQFEQQHFSPAALVRIHFSPAPLAWMHFSPAALARARILPATVARLRVCSRCNVGIKSWQTTAAETPVPRSATAPAPQNPSADSDVRRATWCPGACSFGAPAMI